jgi:hypothetical protein
MKRTLARQIRWLVYLLAILLGAAGWLVLKEFGG